MIRDFLSFFCVFFYILRVHTSVSNTCSDMFFTSFLFTNIRPPFSSCLRFPADGAKHVTAHVLLLKLFLNFLMCSLPNPSPSFFKLQDGPGALSLFCLRWRWDVLRVRVLLVPTRTFFL